MVDDPFLPSETDTKHEDLSDVTAFVSASDIPLQTALEDEPLSTNDVYGWTMDDLPQPVAVYAAQAGRQSTGPANPSIDRQRAANYTQISDKIVQVADGLREMKLAGTDDLYSYEEDKMSILTLKQHEYNLTWSRAVAGAPGTASQMHGLVPWIFDTGIDSSAVTIAGRSIIDTYSASVAYNASGVPFNISVANPAVVTTTAPHGLTTGDTVKHYLNGGTGPSAGLDGVQFVVTVLSATTYSIPFNNAAAVITGGTPRAYGGTNLTPDSFHNLLELAHLKGNTIGNFLFMMGPKVKRQVSSWNFAYNGSGTTLTATPRNHRHVPAEIARLVDYIDIYDSEFGPCYMNLNRYFAGGNPAGGANPDEQMAWTVNGVIYYVMPSSVIVGFDPTFAKTATFRALRHTKLAKDGDRTTGLTLIEGGFKCKNPRAFLGAFGAAAA